jgi:hypothetical protein
MITYALEYNKSSEFSILIDDKSQIVKVKAGKKLLTVYNPKKHPGHISHNKSLTYSPNKYICNKCSGDLFEVAVGYEYPDEDVENPNDISCFCISGKCIACGNGKIVFEDEL